MDTTILIKTKKDLKTQAQELASDLGFSLTDIINSSLRQFVLNQGMVISKIPTDEWGDEGVWETVADFRDKNGKGIKTGNLLKLLEKIG